MSSVSEMLICHVYLKRPFILAGAKDAQAEPVAAPIEIGT